MIGAGKVEERYPDIVAGTYRHLENSEGVTSARALNAGGSTNSQKGSEELFEREGGVYLLSQYRALLVSR